MKNLSTVILKWKNDGEGSAFHFDSVNNYKPFQFSKTQILKSQWWSISQNIKNVYSFFHDWDSLHFSLKICHTIHMVQKINLWNRFALMTCWYRPRLVSCNCAHPNGNVFLFMPRKCFCRIMLYKERPYLEWYLFSKLIILMECLFM